LSSRPKEAERKVFFSVYSTFPAPKNGWNKKHKQIPKKAMKLNLNHQMSGMLEQLAALLHRNPYLFSVLLGERLKIARAKMKNPTQKCTVTLNISRWLHNLFVLNIMFMGWKTSPFSKKKVFLNFCHRRGGISCIWGYPLLLANIKISICLLFPFFVFTKKTLTFRHGSNRWQFFIYFTVARHFRRQIMTEISFITVISA
jgi:hypothetical protein